MVAAVVRGGAERQPVDDQVDPGGDPPHAVLGDPNAAGHRIQDRLRARGPPQWPCRRSAGALLRRRTGTAALAACRVARSDTWRAVLRSTRWQRLTCSRATAAARQTQALRHATRRGHRRIQWMMTTPLGYQPAEEAIGDVNPPPSRTVLPPG